MSKANNLGIFARKCHELSLSLQKFTHLLEFFGFSPFGESNANRKNKVENEAKRFDPKEKICGANQVSFVGNRVE